MKIGHGISENLTPIELICLRFNFSNSAGDLRNLYLDALSAGGPLDATGAIPDGQVWRDGEYTMVYYTPRPGKYSTQQEVEFEALMGDLWKMMP